MMDRMACMKKSLRIRYLLLAIPLGMVLLCAGVYSQVRSYAPMAAREAPTATLTPFLPVTDTPLPPGWKRTPTVTETVPTVLPYVTPTASGETPPWAPYAGPILPSSTPIPTPSQEIKLGEGMLTIALLGIDSLETKGAYRTDAIMILAADRSNNTAALVSFPRDLYVYIPGYGMQRINTAYLQGKSQNYTGGSFGLFQDTMKYNFGLRVDHYVLINFQGFKDMVDRLDGIDVDVAKTLTDYRQGYGTYTISAGKTHMDGSTALWYSRARYTTSDFDRGRRQQEVIIAIAKRLLDLRAWANLPSFFQILSKFVESDLTLDILLPYAGLAGTVSVDSVRRYRINEPNYCSDWTTPQGGMVLLPKYDAIHAMLVEALTA
jgi:LCP family protein required for cell wall assembly